MKRRITIIVVIVVVLAVIIGFVVLRGRQAIQETLASLQTVDAEIGSLVATVGATGTVRANQSAILPWETSGTVGEIFASVGEQVSGGEVLANIEQESLPQNVILARADLVSAQEALDKFYDGYNELAVAQAAQAVGAAEQAVEDAQNYLANITSPARQADIDQAEANMILAREKLEDAQENYDKWKNKGNDVVRATLQSALAQAQKVYDNAVTRYNNLTGTADPLDVTNAQANLDVALANLDKAKKDHEKILKGPDPEDLAAAEARVDAVQATLDSAFITAPFDGTVTMAAPKSGDQVAAGTQAFRVDDLSRLLVDVEVSEIDINRIEVGQEVTLNFDAILDKDYKGEVVEVSPVGTEFQGIVNFQVTVELLDFDERVKPGMTAGLNIVVSQLDNVLLVLNRAVRVENGKRVVYVLNGQIPQSVEIELGASSDTYSEVIGGDLKPGDKIVLNPPVDFFGGGPPGGGGGGGFQP